jgi:hypothetical protein
MKRFYFRPARPSVDGGQSRPWRDLPRAVVCRSRYAVGTAPEEGCVRRGTRGAQRHPPAAPTARRTAPAPASARPRLAARKRLRGHGTCIFGAVPTRQVPVHVISEDARGSPFRPRAIFGGQEPRGHVQPARAFVVRKSRRRLAAPSVGSTPQAASGGLRRPPSFAAAPRLHPRRFRHTHTFCTGLPCRPRPP